MGIALAVVGVATGLKSISQSKKAAKAQRSAVESQRQQAQSQANRSRRQAIRQNLIARAQLQNQAAVAGVSGGSGSSGGLSSATSQFGANMGFSGVQQGLQNNIFQAQSQAIKYQSSASAFGSLSGLAFKGAALTSDPNFMAMFKPTPKSPTATGG